MRTAVKAWIYKIAAFLAALAMMGFGLFASIAIFAESVGIVATMGYTKEASAAILVFIGLVLIWLVTLLGNSANAYMLFGIKKASEVEKS
jgi:uncharacterized membrane protein YjgN (DUF898 family)